MGTCYIHGILTERAHTSRFHPLSLTSDVLCGIFVLVRQCMAALFTDIIMLLFS